MTNHVFTRAAARDHLADIFNRLPDDGYVSLTFACMIRCAFVLLQDAEKQQDVERSLRMPGLPYDNNAGELLAVILNVSIPTVHRYTGTVTLLDNGSTGFGTAKSSPHPLAAGRMAEALQRVMMPILRA